ncbi:Uncharacterized protein DAT39_009445, partial [Clarias magur]
ITPSQTYTPSSPRLRSCRMARSSHARTHTSRYRETTATSNHDDKRSSAPVHPGTGCHLSAIALWEITGENLTPRLGGHASRDHRTARAHVCVCVCVC